MQDCEEIFIFTNPIWLSTLLYIVMRFRAQEMLPEDEDSLVKYWVQVRY